MGDSLDQPVHRLMDSKALYSLARYIDHTQLKPDTTPNQIQQLCQEANQYQFFSVCVPPTYVSLSKECLKNSNVKVCTVLGFPLGYSGTTVQVFEATQSVQNGADELDMVINLGALKSGDYQLVLKGIQEVKAAVQGRLLKVIIETALWSPDEIVKASLLVKEAGAHFVKTSTGFSTRGASIEDIRMIRKAVGPSLGIKASGGIKNANFARELLQAGATRIGSSASVAMVESS